MSVKVLNAYFTKHKNRYFYFYDDAEQQTELDTDNVALVVFAFFASACPFITEHQISAWEFSRDTSGPRSIICEVKVENNLFALDAKGNIYQGDTLQTPKQLLLALQLAVDNNLTHQKILRLRDRTLSLRNENGELLMQQDDGSWIPLDQELTTTDFTSLRDYDDFVNFVLRNDQKRDSQSTVLDQLLETHAAS
jgi:hypothetical protein